MLCQRRQGGRFAQGGRESECGLHVRIFRSRESGASKARAMNKGRNRAFVRDDTCTAQSKVARGESPNFIIFAVQPS